MFTDIFVRRPVLAICVNLLLLVAGLYAVFNLITRQYPRSDLAVVKVSTDYVGANAELVRGFVTTPLERVIASADGIDYLESNSKQGLSEITAHLELNYPVNDALTQIQAKVAQVRNDLPPEAESPRIEVESSDNRFASMYLSFYSEKLKSNEITDYLLRVAQPKLSAVPGVQRADILGARTFAMRIWLKPELMAAVGLSPAEVQAALLANNYLSAPGNTKGSMVTVNLRANTDLKTKEEFEQLVVKQDGEILVRLKDVAEVELGAENYEEDVRFAGQAATFMGVWVLPNANSLDVIQAVRLALPELEANLPPGLSLGVPYDATKYIDDSITEVMKTLIETVLIVVVVIFLFIGSLRSVLVPVVAVPLSLVGAAGLMLLFGFTLNLLTLLAIVLAVGLVVDDAIVMLENAERHVANGKTPYQAALIGARELVGPIVAITITLVAVYAPIGIQGGLTGALFREFAFTLAGAVAVSGFVALTLSPMMSAKLVRTNLEASPFKRRIEQIFARLQAGYSRWLTKVFNFKAGIITAAILFMLLVLPFYMFSMKELAPREDQGVVFGIVQAAPNSSLDQTLIYTEMLQERFASFPEYATSFQLTGPSFGFSGMVIKPFSERDRTSQEIEAEAWMKMADVPGVRVIMTTPPPLPGGSDFPIEFVISSTLEPERLAEYAEQLVGAAFASGKFIFADANVKFDLPQSEIIIDRDKAAILGLDLRSIGQDISAFTGGNYVNRFNIQGRSYKVIAQAERSERLTPDQLANLYIRGPNNSLVPLSAVATFVNRVQPRELKRFQQLNSVTIQGALVPGTSIDQGLTVLEDKAKEILPPGVIVDYAGESRQLRLEGDTLLVTLFFAVILIYLVLAAQFESFRDPFIILMGSVPLALAGSLLFPFLGLTTVNIYSQVGLVTLVGLVAKNGILIVEFANQLQVQGHSREEAAKLAAAVRLRPVLMTSVATVAGHFPLILAAGAGAGARNSIGIVLVSGMFIGTFFTLFVVPILYSVIASQRSKRDLQLPSVIKPLVAVGLALTLTSCAVGPDYQAPEISTPQGFNPSQTADFQTEESEMAETLPEHEDRVWWQWFDDANLQQLITRAVEFNKDVKQSLSRIEQARQLRRSALSEFLPGAQLTGEYNKGRDSGARFPSGGDNSGDGSSGNSDFKFKSYSAGIDALWELDIFGRLRRGYQARDAELGSQIASFHDALRILISEVATTYFNLRGAQQRLAIADQNVALQQESVELAEAKFAIGVTSELDRAQASTQLETTRATIPPLKADVHAAIHRLSVLIGSEPRTLEQELLVPQPIPRYAGPIIIGQPAAMIRRRPDLRVAERNLAAETAEIGVAIGEMFPKVSLLGSVGVEAENFSNLTKGMGTYLYGPSITWTPLDSGRLLAQADAQTSQAEEALLAYEQAVLLALEDVANALERFSAERARAHVLGSALKYSRKAYQIAKVQYREGVLDFLSVLESQRIVLQNERDLVSSEEAVATGLVGIYKALGGGWEGFVEPEQVAPKITGQQL